MMAQWPDDKCIELIDLYHNKRILWDPKDRDHFQKSLKDDAWREIGETMDTPAEDCKWKMINLLASFRREKRKVSRGTCGIGKGRDEAYESRWFAYAAMRFLEDRDPPRRRKTTKKDNLHTEEQRDVLADEMHLEEAVYQEEETATSSSSLIPRPDPSRSPRTTANEDTPAAKKRLHKKDTSDSEMMSSAFLILKNAAESLNQDSTELDEIDALCKYLSAKVHKYSPATQIGVQHAVMDVIMKADRGFFD
ncbi:uncharacterized protein LOC126887153 [Diabrotica virgifera virgifera]|uniref:MADF domain-containing protein n=1 Tax=Diabrotica virgifera virgifera TaxID=50390 RepID=A0ABM5KJT9_DIAVI|nr:uncharacterized protein LOC126887153 [Diabrotica virgifera virgifera]